MLEVIIDDAYEKYIACSSRVTVFAGTRVALIIDSGCGIDTSIWPLAAVTSCVEAIERLLAAFDACVGRVPEPIRPYRGRATRIEVAFLEGAAGLASHGVAGCAVGPAFIKDMVDSVSGVAGFSRVIMPHVLCYELCRNYIFPDEFTPRVDYCLYSSRAIGAPLSPSCWGWVNQGFVNVLGTLLLDELDDPQVGFSYHGHSREKFLADMEAQLTRYVQDGHDWSTTFMHERLLWDPSSSLDNVYSGILINLWRAYGRGAFLTRFFLALNDRPCISKGDAQGARDNFAITMARAARADLTVYFNSLRWPPLRLGGGTLDFSTTR